MWLWNSSPRSSDPHAELRHDNQSISNFCSEQTLYTTLESDTKLAFHQSTQCTMVAKQKLVGPTKYLLHTEGKNYNSARNCKLYFIILNVQWLFFCQMSKVTNLVAEHKWNVMLILTQHFFFSVTGRSCHLSNILPLSVPERSKFFMTEKACKRKSNETVTAALLQKGSHGDTLGQLWSGICCGVHGSLHHNWQG